MPNATSRTTVALCCLGALTAALLGTAQPASAATGTFTSTAPISVPDSIHAQQNTTEITIAASGAATPYPSVVSTSGLSGTIADVDVRLLQMSHTFPDDVDVLLVGPNGQEVVLMSDAGGALDVVDRTLTFDDEAATSLPDGAQITAGTYQPTNYEPGDSWPGPAPDASDATASLSSLDGANPNGTWSLYVLDDSAVDSGRIAAGFEVIVYLTPPAEPYPSTIDVSGALNGVTDVNLALDGVTHGTAVDFDMLLVGPQGQQAIVMSDAGTSAAGVSLRFDDEAVSTLPAVAPLSSGTFRPTNYSSPQLDRFVAPAPDSASAGSSLAVFDGTNPNGAWRLYITDDQVGGSGSLSGWSLEITTVDRPAAPVISAPGSGSADADGAITLTGSAPANSPVRLYDGATVAANVTTSASGSWSAPLTDVSTGTHTYTATSFDSYSNESVQSAAVAVTIDGTAPTGTLSINGGATRTRTRNVTLGVSASDAVSGVGAMRFSNDGVTWSAFESYTTSKTWVLASGDRSRSVYAQFADAAGNVSALAIDAIMLDTVNPKATRTKPLTGSNGVGVRANLKTFFSEALAPSTLTKANVALARAGSGKVVKAKVTYDQVKRKLVLNPAKALRHGTTYQVVVRTGVTDLAGNRLDQKRKRGLQPMKWRFTTG